MMPGTEILESIHAAIVELEADMMVNKPCPLLFGVALKLVGFVIHQAYANADSCIS